MTATLERDGERRDVVVGWVVGCDGMHSAVREAAGIAFPGADIDARWGVFDATRRGLETTTTTSCSRTSTGRR